MKAIDLLEKYPLSAKIVREWFLNQMLESFKDEIAPEEFKQYMLEQGVENANVAVLMDVNPRMLLDVFDENDVIIIIKYHDNFGFSWAVEEADDQSFYKTRKEAEAFAIEVAFDILENQLKPVSDDSNVTADSEDN
jgi:hypothetical protein